MSILPQSLRPEEAARWQRVALAVGAVATVICAVGAPFSPTQFFRAWLAAYQFYLGIGLGCLVVLMIYHMTGGAWGFLIRRVLEAGSRTLPLLALLFIPIGCGLVYLYVWARPEEVAADPTLKHQSIYLNAPFFWGRAFLYFSMWAVITWFLNAWSRRQDETTDPRLVEQLSRLSAPGIIIYGVTITFASVDWIMSLQPSFRSTIFGPLVASGHLLSAFAFALMVLAWIASREPLNDVMSLEALNDLGSLLFTFLVVWAYMNFFQFMLIWIANMRHETIWYLPRQQGGWQWVAWMLVIFHFSIPFFLLLLRDVKRDLRLLSRVAALILFMHLVFSYYQIMPSFPHTTLASHWMDFLTPLGIGGLWLAYFLWQLEGSPLLVSNDPNRKTAEHLHHLDVEAAVLEEELEHA